jgi:hypothetical protein
MRTLLICTLSATLLGCACPGAQQVRLAGCDAQGCPQRVADTPPVETKPAPVKPKVVAKKSTKFTTATKVTKKPSPDQPSKPPEKPEQKAAATTTATPAAPPATPPAPPTDTSEAVVQKAKTKIAASIDEPASAEFGDMKRALRKNTFGQPIDTICGHVKGKKKSGETTGDLPFLYIVKDDTAYVVVDGNSESVAAVAYRTICSNPDTRSMGNKPRE